MSQAALFTMSWLVGASPAACAEPPHIATSVAAVHGPVMEQASYGVSDLQEMARRSGLPLRHATLGFYIGDFGQEILVDTARRASPDGSRCGYLTTVTVRLFLANRLVEVADDLDSRGCQAAAVLQHYRKHAGADDLVLSRYVQSVTRALEDAWPQMRTKLGPSGDNDEPGLRGVVRVVLDGALRDYDRVRTETIAAVDTPNEVESLTCGSRT